MLELPAQSYNFKACIVNGVVQECSEVFNHTRASSTRIQSLEASAAGCAQRMRLTRSQLSSSWSGQ